MSVEYDAKYYAKSAHHKAMSDDTKGALEDLDQAILLSPTNIEYYAERALLFSDLALHSPAEDCDNIFQRELDDLNMIIELGTELYDLAFAHEQRAICFGELSRYQELQSELDWLLDNECEVTSTYGWRAAREFRLGHFENALKDYSILLQVDPDDTNALQERAKTYYNLQHYQAALDDLNKLLSIRNGGFIEYSWRARCYYRLGKSDEAREDFIKSTNLAGGTPLDISPAEYMRILFSED